MRRRLPNRRLAVTSNIEVMDQTYVATLGIYDSEVREIFLSGAKSGSAMDSILGDAAVIISIALQQGIPAEALSRSVARIRTTPLLPENIDDGNGKTVPASAIGATLDLIQKISAELAEPGKGVKNSGGRENEK